MWNTPTQEQLDQIPQLYETENIELQDKLIYLHFFMFQSDWYIVEFDKKDTFFGFTILNGDMEMAEWGYISFDELKSINVNSVEIDCETNWRIKPASEIEKIQCD